MTPEQLVDFNINNYILVKLTDIGRAELRRQHDELYNRIGKSDSGLYIRPAEDADGWSKWQLWGLMNSLGHMCHIGFDPPFQTTIRFEVEVMTVKQRLVAWRVAVDADPFGTGDEFAALLEVAERLEREVTTLRAINSVNAADRKTARAAAASIECARCKGDLYAHHVPTCPELQKPPRHTDIRPEDLGRWPIKQMLAARPAEPPTTCTSNCIQQGYQDQDCPEHGEKDDNDLVQSYLNEGLPLPPGTYHITRTLPGKRVKLSDYGPVVEECAPISDKAFAAIRAQPPSVPREIQDRESLTLWPEASHGPSLWSVGMSGPEGIAIEVDGLAIVRTAREWHRLAAAQDWIAWDQRREPGMPSIDEVVLRAVKCPVCGWFNGTHSRECTAPVLPDLCNWQQQVKGQLPSPCVLPFGHKGRHKWRSAVTPPETPCEHCGCDPGEDHDEECSTRALT